jgi:hypothetical protein
MKRALAIVLLLAALAPAASLLAAAMACHAMPCCARQQPVKIAAQCCDPAMTREVEPASVAKSVVVSKVATVTTVEGAREDTRAPFSGFARSSSSPPRGVRLRLASLSTLLI